MAARSVGLGIALPGRLSATSWLDAKVGGNARATRPVSWMRATRPALLGLAAALSASCGGRVDVGPGADSGTLPQVETLPSAELCNRLDDDGDGQVDEHCSCDPALNGGKQDCYSGPVATRGTGICRAGYQRCVGDQEFHGWGECVDEVTPQAEVLGDRLDNDCDGTIDGNTPTPPPTCHPPATNYPTCTTNAAGQCINGMTNPPTCTAPAPCVAASWTPDPGSVCSGLTFTQTSNCGLTRPASGTRTSGECAGCGAFAGMIGSAQCAVNHNTGRGQPIGTTMPMTMTGGTGSCPSAATCTETASHPRWRYSRWTWISGGLTTPSCLHVPDYNTLGLPAAPNEGAPCTPHPTSSLRFFFREQCVPAGSPGWNCAGGSGLVYCPNFEPWQCLHQVDFL